MKFLLYLPRALAALFPAIIPALPPKVKPIAQFLGAVLLGVVGMGWYKELGPQNLECQVLWPDEAPGSLVRSATILKDHLPPGVSVEIQYADLDGYLGVTYASDDDMSFLILLDSGLSEQAAWMVMLHEWGHVLAPNDRAHGDSWASGQGRAYRIAVGL